MASKIFKWGITAACLAFAAPVHAGWKLVPKANPVTLGSMKITPTTDWNRASAKPGKQGAAWTHDGFELNELNIFAAVPSGQSIYRERDAKRNPMPKFSGTMFLLDLADLFERSFRASRDITEFAIEETTPAKLGGQPAVHIRYVYTLPNDELLRKGEARLSVVKEALYSINFQAPALHYFDAGIGEARAIMDSASLSGK